MSNNVVQIEPQRQAVTSVTPMQMLELAMNQGADLDKMQKLMDLHERWEANNARKAFNVAFAAFKAEAVKIIKTTIVKDGPLKGKTHANLFDVVSAVTPALSKHGLTMSWSIATTEKDLIEVTCLLRHIAGHFESVALLAAPDAGPGRNAIQARASTISYLERYTALAILGLAAQDADDDGNGAGEQIELITDKQAADLLAKIEEVGANKQGFLKWLKVDSCADLPASRYKAAIQALNDKAKAGK